MTLPTLAQLLGSSLPTRLLLTGMLAVLFFGQRKKDTEGFVNSVLLSLAILVVRDVAYVVFMLDRLHFIGDLVYVYSLFIILTTTWNRRRLLLWPLGLGFAGLIGLYIARMFFYRLLVLPPQLFPYIVVLSGAALLVIGLLRRTKGETQTQQVMRVLWPAIGGTVLAYGLGLQFIGYGSLLLERLLVPLLTWWYLLAGLRLFYVQDRQLVQALSYYEAAIDSLYNLFMSTGSALHGNFTVEDVLKNMNETIVAETGGDGGIIFLVDEFDDQISVKSYTGHFPPPFPLPESLPRKALRVESYMKHLQFSLDDPLFGEMARSGTDLFIPDVSRDPRITVNGDEDFLRLSSFMAVALMVEERIIGLIAVVKTEPEDFFTENDFDRFKLLSNFGTLSLSQFFSFLEAKERSGLKQSADTAAEIQKAITPKRIPQYPHVQIGAHSQSAIGISGDYYDLIQTRKDRIIGVVGDVAGKGVAAALVMVMVRSILHLVTNTNRDMATVLDWINRGLTGKVDIDHYATLAVIAIDTNTGEVEYASAGHQPLLIYRRKTGALETVDIQSVPIGVERSAVFNRKVFKLETGDIAVLYTDGLVEAMNAQGKQYGRRSIATMISKHKDLAPKEIVAKLRSDVASFVGSTRQHDDQTVLVFKMKL